MNKILAGIAVVWISCQLAMQVCAQPTTAFAQPLTQTEQARLLGLMTSKSESPQFLLVNSSDYHIARAKSLLGEMDQLNPDGTRSGNPLLRKVLYQLERARQSGVSYESSLNAIYLNSSRAPVLIQDRKEQLIKDMKACRQLGLLTSENMERLQQGLAPVVTQGNPKYIGEPVEIDHRVPIRGPNGRAIYENDPANLQLLPQSINREKWANIDEISRGHEAKLDRAYWADRNTMAGGVINSGFGLLLLYTSGSALLADLDSSHDNLTSHLRIGQHASFAVSGGAMTAVGISEFGSLFLKSDRAVSLFGGVTKWGGRTTLAGIIIAEPIGIYLDFNDWDKMTTSQRIGSIAQHTVNVGAGSYRLYRVAKSARILGLGVELATGEEVFGLGPDDPLADIAAGATISLAAGAQHAYDYFHPIQPSWNSSTFSRLSSNQKRQVEDSIYHNYGMAR